MKAETKVYTIAAIFYLLPQKRRHRFLSFFTASCGNTFTNR